MASGWPEWCQGDEAKQAQYLANYKEKEGVELEGHLVEKNPGLRSLAQIMPQQVMILIAIPLKYAYLVIVILLMVSYFLLVVIFFLFFFVLSFLGKASAEIKHEKKL